jgi:putative oxidoreductase
LAGGSELAGGVLTAAGALSPVGPLALAGAMSVASLTHADKGPLMQKGGFELPATNLAAAIVLLGTGPGRFSVDQLVGLRFPRGLTRLTVLGVVALSGYSAVQVAKTKWRPARPEAPAAAPESEATKPT